MATSLASRSRTTVPRVLNAGLSALALLLLAGVPSAMGQAASPSPTAHDRFMLPHDVPDLEALFPDEVDGIPLRKSSVGRPTREGMNGSTSGFDYYLANALGVAFSDVETSFVTATGTATIGPLFSYVAYRVAGVPGETLVEAYAGMTAEIETGEVAQVATIDGREVVWLAHERGNGIWIWAEGDTLVGIYAADLATVEKLYRLMPLRSPAASSSPTA